MLSLMLFLVLCILVSRKGSVLFDSFSMVKFMEGSTLFSLLVRSSGFVSCG